MQFFFTNMNINIKISCALSGSKSFLFEFVADLERQLFTSLALNCVVNWPTCPTLTVALLASNHDAII
jgi:hypothetical protein